MVSKLPAWRYGPVSTDRYARSLQERRDKVAGLLRCCSTGSRYRSNEPVFNFDVPINADDYAYRTSHGTPVDQRHYVAAPDEKRYLDTIVKLTEWKFRDCAERHRKRRLRRGRRRRPRRRGRGNRRRDDRSRENTATSDEK